MTVDDNLRVYVAYPESVIRRGAIASLGQDLRVQVVGESDDALTALDEIEKLLPDAAVLGDHVGDGAALDLVEKVRAVSSTRVVVLDGADFDAERMYVAFASGVTGYAPAACTPAEFCDVVVAAARGNPELPRVLQAQLVRQIQIRSTPGIALPTARERDVLLLMADGYRTQEIAQRLHLGLSTVKKYQGQLYEKLNAPTAAGAVAAALRGGLIR
jgi:DNA-binding NarL/FixJ family response regulator